MGVFCTVADVRDFLQVDVDEAAAMRAIVEATAAIRNYCRQWIELVEDEEITLDVMQPRSNLLLPELPVVEVSEVIEDGELLVDGEDYMLAQYGQLMRLAGGNGSYSRWAQGVQIVVVTYTHGYDTLPDDVVAVATRAASRAYQAGLFADDTSGVPGVASKSLGDYSVSYTSGSGGGVGEGMLGASAARMLLLSEKDMLNKYRIKGT
jgi:hypothetical protein